MSSSPLLPAVTATKRIVGFLADQQYIRHSRIPSVIDLFWTVLLSTTHQGRALRRPFWLPYERYEAVGFDEKGDNALRATLSELRGRFRIYLKDIQDGSTEAGASVDGGVDASADGVDSKEAVAWTPMGVNFDHSMTPTICFSPSYDGIVERVRQWTELHPTPDDIAELRQLDVNTIVVFARELGHVLWRARYPGATLTPEKHKAQFASKAKAGQGEGDELIEVALWGGVVDIVLLRFQDIPVAQKPHLYSYSLDEEVESLVPHYNTVDEEMQRWVCIVRNPSGNQYLTCSGAARMYHHLLSPPYELADPCFRPIDAFTCFEAPSDPLSHIPSGRPKASSSPVKMLTQSDSMSSLPSSGSLKALDYGVPDPEDTEIPGETKLHRVLRPLHREYPDVVGPPLRSNPKQCGGVILMEPWF
ncbi:hypothetical protein B0H17DRAFT_336549 [Mycena rosella]|uniref:Uncharacterized protein n=1 Tax=Mycena rosella TaxID=1033263 RepID=A0AAD7G615_MYCRO|nr:hypothetical protein B0H17DRAFT_336549 [Mycena rosella]